MKWKISKQQQDKKISKLLLSDFGFSEGDGPAGRPLQEK